MTVSMCLCLIQVSQRRIYDAPGSVAFSLALGALQARWDTIQGSKDETSHPPLSRTLMKWPRGPNCHFSLWGRKST